MVLVGFQLLPPGGIGGAIEPLQGDQSFQVGVHGLFEQKKGPAEAEPEFYMLAKVGPPGFEPGTGRL